MRKRPSRNFATTSFVAAARMPFFRCRIPLKTPKSIGLFPSDDIHRVAGERRREKNGAKISTVIHVIFLGLREGGLTREIRLV